MNTTLVKEMTPQDILLHITPRASWQPQADTFIADSLQREGFIHCSTPEQVLMPANAMFKGQTDLILLVIDPAKVEAQIIFEDCYESGHKFPHIYGPLNTDAVIATAEFPCEPDGSFELPRLPGV